MSMTRTFDEICQDLAATKKLMEISTNQDDKLELLQLIKAFLKEAQEALETSS